MGCGDFVLADNIGILERERTGKNQLVGKLKNEELYLFSLSHYCSFFCFGGGHYFVFFLVDSLLWWFLFSVFLFLFRPRIGLRQNCLGSHGLSSCW